MKRRKFTREFKRSVLRELENDKTAAQISRENSIHPAMLSKWKREYQDNPETAFNGSGNTTKLNTKLAESERIIGQLYAENTFLKKVLTSLEAKLLENRKLRGQS
jgi:transposase-like protein